MSRENWFNPVVDGMKCCSKCDETKSVDQFYAHGGHVKQPCRKCWRAKVADRRSAEPESFKLAERDYNLGRLYGLGIEEYETILREQGGVCAICGEPPRQDGPERTTKLYVDHDHSAGDVRRMTHTERRSTVRQLLCFGCNAALGALKDDPRLFASCIDYLERWGRSL